jgi:SAM-dependent methyltransferase
MPTYDPRAVAAAYDAFGEREWERHETAPFRRVAFHIHRHQLSEFVRSGDRVLEAGAGAGRFSVELARLGARLTVIDVSPVQMDLHRRHLADEDLEASVEERALADIIDLSRFPDGAFDAVVCYGGPLSYVMERADDALAELLRVVRPGGHVLLSVMSNLGSLHAFLSTIPGDIDQVGIDAVERVRETGDLPEELASVGAMHMYTWEELRALLGRHECEPVAASAANFLSVRNDEVCERWLQDPSMWERFLAWEVRACREPGALDAGTHVLAVVRRTNEHSRKT